MLIPSVRELHEDLASRKQLHHILWPILQLADRFFAWASESVRSLALTAG